ncbi:MAG TPA: UDP-glucose/GDP-mannose dehydrogenase family protein [Bacillota bacterium]|nr:UDP-glucose/GDP-mannose dehydrogenase family protein [Bacillota bacterium]HOJ84156.1 UDP-glucose/GDP-mannose dehydrogenase family protein [Bacillota bacterium]HOL16019.1 UDP-glucose/GDP-mannose dehydrogenase family protein [Bacillota bacterium]HPZ11599.1 UDP-glucose/GDP-mannose dehydrogenase family protein [Bacillota bacterium]HQE09843.1 UDP-glucose/GDP-mannose dehydrogenase family protein [Bacillota bacterium]
MPDLIVGIVGGGGHVGLVQAAGLASLGYYTIAYDLNSARIRELQKGIIPFYEPGLAELVRSGLKCKLLEFTGKIERLRKVDLAYICTGTPSLPGGRTELLQVENAVTAVARAVQKRAIIAVKSTVPVGTARRLSRLLQQQRLSEKAVIVSNPEFLSEGSAVDDFWHPSRIIIGSAEPEAAEIVAGVYAPPHVPVIKTGWENAEMIKYGANAFLALKVSFINLLACLCEKSGGDIRVVSKGLGLDPRIGPSFLEAGAGFSGPCLEKDLRSLIGQFQDAGEEAPLLEAALYINQRQRYLVVSRLKENLGELKGKKIAVLGLSFKPGTDDLRETHTLPVIEQLVFAGAEVTVHDPLLGMMSWPRQMSAFLPDLRWASSPYEAAEGKDALLILTAWPEYRDLNPAKLKSCLANPLVVDGRNLFEPSEMAALGIDYRGVGIGAEVGR